MVHRRCFVAAPSSLFATALACVAVAALLPACQSDGEDAEDDATASPAPASPSSSGNASAGDVARPAASPTPAATATAVEAQQPAARNPAPASPPEEAPAPAAAAGAMASPPPAPAQTFAACTYSEGNYGRNCDSIFVTVKQTSPPRCVQLTIDNCGGYGRQSLGVSVPMPWRVDSAAVGSSLNECDPGVFYPSSSVAQRASGSITWTETSRLPTDIALDVTLVTSSGVAETADVDVTTAAPLVPTVCAN